LRGNGAKKKENPLIIGRHKKMRGKVGEEEYKLSKTRVMIFSLDRLNDWGEKITSRRKGQTQLRQGVPGNGLLKNKSIPQKKHRGGARHRNSR